MTQSQGALALEVSPSTFKFESHAVRVIMRDGEPWFVAVDVCAAIELANSRVALKALDADEKGVSSTYTPGGQQNVAIVSESGMYTLVLRCRNAVKPGTVPHRFRKWVTGEVLPQIRRSGRYEAPTPREPKDQARITPNPDGTYTLVMQGIYREKHYTIGIFADLICEMMPGRDPLSTAVRHCADSIYALTNPKFDPLPQTQIVARRPGLGR